MIIDEILTESDAELVLECHDRAVDYHGFVVIHSTVRGPALGGIRRCRYVDRTSALEDAVALARSMSYKSALADLPFGGGKSVISDAGGASREALYHAHACVLEHLGGRYIGAEDLGTTPDDIARMRAVTRFLAAQTDPAPWTARGVRCAIQAAVMHKWKSDSLVGCTIALQGCGAIGYCLAQELHEAGASLLVADPDRQRAQTVSTRFSAVIVDPASLLDVEADVLAPCAFGAVLGADSIPRLQVSIVAGAANNQLRDDTAAQALADRGILFVPDYAINAGGLMTAGVDLLGWPLTELERRVDDVYRRTLHILEAAARDRVPPLVIADRMATARLLEDDEPPSPTFDMIPP